MPLDFKFEIGNPFLLGNAIGFLGYAGACKLQRVHFVRRPWHLITTMLLTGTGFQAYSGAHESFTDDLVRKRRLYVQRRRKRFNSSDDVADRVNDDKDLYKNISKDLAQ
ncbi:hypothetical protein NAEGRDRAFT_79287 [Naegleria gruberi]|uniref:Uncharacterized protein n=1 Tax=Naegleria gruberi TaxID=5762 RepID=D2VB93_NAEGR|nr:uncharacterized protein NAEGRDRAFT_79287 [Naegleria gruberi]EFC45756.1 hypothetical protein NAEGRDRAFT_79287 [Naegleria gruberi]|eukprot:XP_002678500.1 hypothetical protein NAEGRDRAFT_79287 [Naegleria gruberi strain NEG-M]